MNITYHIIINLIIYIPFHLFEEAIGDFPRWMFTHKWLPYHMTHGHWMANNIFIYYPFLLCATALFLLDNSIFLCCGAAILIWGIINFCDHFFYTLKDKKVSPGLLTGGAFLVNSIFGLIQFSKLNPSIGTIILAILIGGILFGAPIGLCVVFYKFFNKYINRN